eukprot:gnl/MRDRNA2_/MRDRNA2_63325_c0_seq1.p1 gnl/MRDRNA2_/MRDRNA2_63325_c0~~gnl/MRDRNA2_/MRDRNA2_63325_c0_seq1.p1  ORF type:complete len:345 (+),score=53.13 gnl/MRDRNA2_/MRDRNA2_63325_c0_seq1:64-1098(+)
MQSYGISSPSRSISLKKQSCQRATLKSLCVFCLLDVGVVADKLFSRAMQMPPLHHKQLDGTVLGKPGNLISNHVPSSSVVVSRLASTLPTHSVRTAHNSRAMFPADVPSNRFSIRAKADPQGKTASDFTFKDAKTGKVRTDYGVLLYLIDKKLKAVTGPQALEMMKDKGAVLVDTRLEKDFKEKTMEGAVNVCPVKPGQASLKSLLVSAMGVQAVEPNPNFAVEAKERLSSDRPIIVACDRGGRLKGSVDSDEAAEDAGLRAVRYEAVQGADGKFTGKQRISSDDGQTGDVVVADDPALEIGWESRSLKTAYELFQLGFTNIYFLLGGISKWQRDGLPMAPGKM